MPLTSLVRYVGKGVVSITENYKRNTYLTRADQDSAEDASHQVSSLDVV